MLVFIRVFGLILICVLCFLLHFVSYWRLTPELRVAPTRTKKNRTTGSNPFGVSLRVEARDRDFVGCGRLQQDQLVQHVGRVGSECAIAVGADGVN